MIINKRFFKDNKILIILITLTFILGFTTAFAMPVSWKGKILGNIFDKFSEFKGSNTQEFISIFKNNLWVSVISLALGFTIIIPFGIVFFNGLGIGILTDIFLRLSELNPSYITLSLVAILPHGILEVPTFLITSALSSLIGLKIFFAGYFYKDKNRRQTIFGILKSFVIIIIPLILIAALIEGYITPVLISKAQEAANFSALGLVDRKDDSLEELVLDESDLFATLRLRASSFTPNDQASSDTVQGEFIKTLYNDDYLNAYKIFIKHGVGNIRKVFKMDDGEGIVTIVIYRFDSDENAKLAADLIEKSKVNNSKAGSHKGILYMVRVSGLTDKTFDDIFNLQDAKIKNIMVWR